MKKSFGVYSIIWAICLAVFNVIVFVTPSKIGDVSKFTGVFWIAYAFITAAFVGQLLCAFIAMRRMGLKGFFYKIPLISISYGGLVTMLIVGSIFLAIPVLPEWVGIIACTLVLAFNAIAVIKAGAAAHIVAGIDAGIKKKTLFIKALSTDAEVLMNSAHDDGLRAIAKKVYEAIRYSDPMAAPELADVDSGIQAQFNAFSVAVNDGDAELANETANTLLVLVEGRNKKIKLLK